MKKFDFWNQFRGYRDKTIEGLTLIGQSLDDLKQTLVYFNELNEVDNYLKGKAPTHMVKYPGCSIEEQIKPYVIKNHLFEAYYDIFSKMKEDIKKCGGKDKYLQDLNNRIKNKEGEIELYKEEMSKFPGQLGKVECLLDFQKNGYKWIINEALGGEFLYRFWRGESFFEQLLMKSDIYGYLDMVEFITKKNIYKAKYGKSRKEIINYKYTDEELEKLKKSYDEYIEKHKNDK